MKAVLTSPRPLGPSGYHGSMSLSLKPFMDKGRSMSPTGRKDSNLIIDKVRSAGLAESDSAGGPRAFESDSKSENSIKSAPLTRMTRPAPEGVQRKLDAALEQQLTALEKELDDSNRRTQALMMERRGSDPTTASPLKKPMGGYHESAIPQARQGNPPSPTSSHQLQRGLVQQEKSKLQKLFDMPVGSRRSM
eukprot:TRINITY_DN7579_c0_g1_i2.p1 TRINITY_DN7579_c0_g1~~TRINITY_DN7579_c0_g1_i2.p1  ORF type:complete len:192 (+),score=41.70 TRINITY_DN7579_c0_g1_i2:355-930(+)